jgi:hypothetical protein
MFENDAVIIPLVLTSISGENFGWRDDLKKSQPDWLV